MRRWAFGISAVLSLVLFTMTVGLWIHSYFRTDFVFDVVADFDPMATADPQAAQPPPGVHGFWHDEWVVRDCRGLFSVTHSRHDLMGFSGGKLQSKGWHFDVGEDLEVADLVLPPPRLLGRVGIWFDARDTTNGDGWTSERTLTLPYWLPALLTAILPARAALIAWRRRRAKRRALADQCTACGYDLRASADRCPECGAASAKLGIT